MSEYEQANMFYIHSCENEKVRHACLKTLPYEKPILVIVVKLGRCVQGLRI